MMGIRNARSYSNAEREDALKRTAEIGPTAAAAELGIPTGTLASWTFYAKKRAAAAAMAALAATSSDAAALGVTGGRPVAAPAKAMGAAKALATTRADAMGPAKEPAAKGVEAARPTRQAPVARAYTPSQRAEALESVAEIGVTATARRLGMSRFSLREWQRKQAQFAEGKATRSPLEDPDAVPKDERDAKILEVWRAHPGLGPSQVRNQLRRGGFKVSVHTVRVVMDANGYVTPRVRRTEAHDHRYEAVRPNQLWHLDFLHRHINKQAVYLLLIIDDYSRFIVGHWLDDAERVEGVMASFERASTLHGRPESSMSDGGSGFWSWRGVGRFTRLLDEYGVDQIVAKVPQVNGKIEVLNANIQKELFNVEHFFDLAETRRRLDAWVDFYNMRRTHHALGGILVPADRYFGRAERVLAEIEAGRPADGVGLPVPSEARLLDLFKVTSQRGEVEVRLMGRRIWPPMG